MDTHSDNYQHIMGILTETSVIAFNRILSLAGLLVMLISTLFLCASYMFIYLANCMRHIRINFKHMKQDYIEVYLNKVELIEQYLDNSNIIVLLQQYIDDMKHGNVYDECDEGDEGESTTSSSNRSDEDDDDDDDDDKEKLFNCEICCEDKNFETYYTFRRGRQEFYSCNDCWENRETQLVAYSAYTWEKCTFPGPGFYIIIKDENEKDIKESYQDLLLSLNKNREQENEDAKLARQLEKNEEEKSNIIYKEVVFEDPTFSPLTKEEGNCEIDDEEIVSINKNILTSSVQEEEDEEDEEDEEESSIIYKEVVFEDPTFTPLTDKNNDSENTPPVRLEPLD